MSESIFGKRRQSQLDSESQWLSVSDLMAGLMMVFLFISIVLMRNAMIEKDKIKQIAATYQDTKVKIHDALIAEFKEDLETWGAEINQKDLSFNFKSPEVLFATGQIQLKPRFKEILSNFFPRYMAVIEEYRDTIEEIRIEGHTSSNWDRVSTEDEAYSLNMNLSQGRTRSVLAFLYELKTSEPKRDWIKQKVAAVGYSSSKRIIENGKENAKQSRRVTFKLVSNSEVQMLKIIQE
jgi:outer membrane protein OmpA-like peptidoglycan-associated protein